MSRVREFFEDLKEGILAVAPGLSNLVPELGAEMSRLATQGQAELASVLFTGNGYVPYGQGQNREDKDGNEGVEPPKLEREGREM